VIFCAPRGPAPATEAAAMERWHPKRDVTRQEQFILKRLEKKRKLFGFPEPVNTNETACCRDY